MSSLGTFLGSSPAHLLLCLGVAATLGVLHLWLTRRIGDESWWVAVWAGLSCVFIGARGVQLTTPNPADALLAGKLAIAVGPYLVWAIVGFGRNANGGEFSRRNAAWLLGISVAWTIGMFGTPWFVVPEVSTRTDFFGREHFAVHSRWPVNALSLYIAGALVWGVRRLRRGGSLTQGDRLVLLAGFSVYAVLGVGAVLTSAGVIRAPAMAEYGPLAVALSLTYLLVQRRRRTEVQLEALLDEQRSRLAASEGRYRDLVENAPVGVLACDGDGRVTTANPTMHAMLEQLGSAPGDATADALLAEHLRETLDAVAMSGNLVRAEHRLPTRPAGGQRVWQVTASPIDAEDAAVLVVADDITKRSQLEQQLRQAQRMDSIGQLAAGIAHEINNPMAFVRANLAHMRTSCDELAKGVPADDARQELLADLDSLLDESMEGVERTIAIVRDMQDLARAGEEGDPASEIAPILEAATRVASVLDRGGVAIQLSEIPALRVRGASGPLRQVFLNLVINAVQAVGEGGHVWVEAAQDSRFARITVHDDGPGVQASVRPRLFDPFFTTKKVGEGTGLGLYISYQIVRKVGGDIRVGDGPQGGASFEVSLPLVADD